jgi:hypothetical protein
VASSSLACATCHAVHGYVTVWRRIAGILETHSPQQRSSRPSRETQSMARRRLLLLERSYTFSPIALAPMPTQHDLERTQELHHHELLLQLWPQTPKPKLKRRRPDPQSKRPPPYPSPSNSGAPRTLASEATHMPPVRLLTPTIALVVTHIPQVRLLPPTIALRATHMPRVRLLHPTMALRTTHIPLA